MNLVDNRSTSPRVILNQSSKPSKKNLKITQKQKIMVIILAENDTVKFEEFCLQIYSQSIYLAHKNVTPILLCYNYEEYQAIEKDTQMDFYILSSEKTIEKLNDGRKYRENWVVFDSGIKGSKKEILDMPNVVYYTKQLQSLRNKLQARNFIPKQTLLNEKYRRVYQSKQRKVQNHLVTPIQELITQSKLSSRDNLQKLQTQKLPSLVEALKSQTSHKTQSLQNYSPYEKPQEIQNYNSREPKIQLLSPSTYQSSESKNFEPKFIDQYIQQKFKQNNYGKGYGQSVKITQNQSKQTQKQTTKKYPNTYVGPGSNRIIDLTDYQKYNQNGVFFCLQKKTPEKFFLNNAPQTLQQNFPIKKQKYQNKQNKQKNQNNEYFMENKCNFDPQNATYDDQILYNDPKNQQNNSKKLYNTCDYEFYNIETYPQKLSNQIKQKANLQISRKNFHSENDKKVHKRTSEQMEEYLDAISSYQIENDDYQIQSIKKANKFLTKFTRNLNNSQPLHKPPLPTLPESHVRKLINRQRPKSLSKANQLSNRFVGSDSFYHNKKKDSLNSNFEHYIPENTVESSRQSQRKSIDKSISKSLPSKGVHRIVLKSVQKQKKMGLSKEILKFSKYQQGIGPSNISQMTKEQKSTVQSYIVYVPMDGNIKKSNKIILQGKNSESLMEKFGLSRRGQEISILYLVDHLMENSVLIGLQQVITPNDSVYTWKNLSQLRNQICQSVEIYNFVFVFKEQLIIAEELERFYQVNPTCYVVDLNSRNREIGLNMNTVKIRKIGEFQDALRTIVQRKYQLIASQ